MSRDPLAVLRDAPAVTVKGVTVLHNNAEWRVCTNRHPECDGRRWGWIEGAPGNVCWSNSKTFNENAAHDMVNEHSKWLEDQKPVSIKLMEAREAYVKAAKRFDTANDAYLRARSELDACERLLLDLAHFTPDEDSESAVSACGAVA